MNDTTVTINSFKIITSLKKGSQEMLVRIINDHPGLLIFSQPPIPLVDISANTKMPSNSRDHEAKPQQNSGPQHSVPLADGPSIIAQSPQGHTKMENVTQQERGE